MSATPGHFREVLAGAAARYLTVTPRGLLVGDGAPRVRVDVALIEHGDARTLYRGRRPACRSLDGARSITDASRQCAACLDRAHCTPQIRVELHVDGAPYRLLLAYTSARNFLLYVAALRRRGLAPDALRTRIDVRDRGHWGELRFAQVPTAKRFASRRARDAT